MTAGSKVPDFIRYPNPLLSQPAILRPVDEAMLVCGAQLLAAAREVQAYGLAATHIGQLEPVIVASLATSPSERDYRLFYNPRITAFSPDSVTAAEGSVSMPGIEVPVARASWIELAYDDADGETSSDRFDGFAARIIQHETDQMNGVFFLSRVSRLKRDTALRKFAKHR